MRSTRAPKLMKELNVGREVLRRESAHRWGQIATNKRYIFFELGRGGMQLS
jgi:hypothetical protein